MKKHYSIMMIIGLLVFASGCLTLGRGSGILTSKEQQWTIPKDTKFYAIQTPKYKQLTEFTAEDDLAVVASTRQDRLDLMLRELLRLVDDDDVVGDRASTDVGEHLQLDEALILKLPQTR